MRTLRDRGKGIYLLYTREYTLCVSLSDTQLPVCTVQSLIEHGMPIDFRYDNRCPTFLQRSVMDKNVPLLKTLILYNVNVNACVGHAIRTAVWHNNEEMTDILIAAGADVNISAELKYHVNPAIVLAIDAASAVIVSKIIAAGAVFPKHALRMAKSARLDRKEKVAIIQKWMLVLPTE